MDKNTNSFLVSIINEISRIKGISVDITRPNDVAEFLVPANEWDDDEKMSLYDLLNYLGSSNRNFLKLAITMQMPYYVEKLTMSNKEKALARIECDLIGCQDEAITYYLKHDRYVLENGEARESKEPLTLMGIDIKEFKDGADNELVNYIIELFKDSELSKISILGTEINPYDQDKKLQM